MWIKEEVLFCVGQVLFSLEDGKDLKVFKTLMGKRTELENLI